jgi:hypothetical protein
MPALDPTPTPTSPAVMPSVGGRRRAFGSLERTWRQIVDAATRPLYMLYTRRLVREVLSQPRPRHIAVIMDGNRRWAIREGFLDHGVGHQRGAEKALELIGLVC